MSQASTQSPPPSPPSRVTRTCPTPVKSSGKENHVSDYGGSESDSSDEEFTPRARKGAAASKSIKGRPKAAQPAKKSAKLPATKPLADGNGKMTVTPSATSPLAAAAPVPFGRKLVASAVAAAACSTRSATLASPLLTMPVGGRLSVGTPTGQVPGTFFITVTNISVPTGHALG